MMRTEMTGNPASPSNSLKGGGAKAVRDESARVGLGQAKSAGAEGDDSGGDFSNVLMSLGGDASTTAEVSTTTPTPTQDVNFKVNVSDTVSDNVSDEKLTETNQSPVADEATQRVPAQASPWVSVLGMDEVLLSMPTPVTAAAAAVTSGAMSAAQEKVIATALPPGTTDVDAYVSTAAVALKSNASGDYLSQRDSKNDLSPAPGQGVNGRSDEPNVAEQPALMKFSATALEGGAQKTIQKTAVTMDGGVWSTPPFQFTESRMAGTPATGVGGNAAAATTLAQQVNYWIGRDVQSAELKLDGLGHSPVEVSISMQGREAHIEFRAEQVQARQIIEQAMPQLKALLQSEGLALAGVSIGASGAETSFSQAKQPKQQTRQGAARVAELGLMDAAGQTRASTGRALDLFV